MSNAALLSSPAMTSDAQFQDEVRRGERFTFGKNWASFLETLDDARIAQAEQSLKEMLRVDSLEGKRFLDAGSGSGLFSLAAKRLGANVVSFDFDPQSVACTAELRRRYFPGFTDVVRPAGLGSRSELPQIARLVRRRLLLGRTAPHGPHVGRAGERRAAREAWRPAVHRPLQR